MSVHYGMAPSVATRNLHSFKLRLGRLLANNRTEGKTNRAATFIFVRRSSRSLISHKLVGSLALDTNYSTITFTEITLYCIFVSI